MPGENLTYDPTYAHGEYSYYENAKKVQAADYDGLSIGLTASGEPGDKDAAIRENAIQGLWLPLYIPDGYDGGRSDGKPSVIIYAANTVASMMEQQVGCAAHSSPECDDARVHLAEQWALDTAGYTSGGSPYAKEVG